MDLLVLHTDDPLLLKASSIVLVRKASTVVLVKHANLKTLWSFCTSLSSCLTLSFISSMPSCTSHTCRHQDCTYTHTFEAHGMQLALLHTSSVCVCVCVCVCVSHCLSLSLYIWTYIRARSLKYLYPLSLSLYPSTDGERLTISGYSKSFGVPALKCV